MEEDAGGAFELHAFRTDRRRESHARCPFRRPRNHRPDPDPGGRADRRLRPLSRQADGRRPRRRLRDRLQGRPRHARGRGARARPRRAALRARCRCSRSATTAAAARSPSTGRAAGSSPSRRGPTGSRPGRTSCAARSKRARRTSPASSPRARCCSAASPSRSTRGSPRTRATATAWSLAAARGRRRPRARALRRLVRALPALVRRLPRRREGAAAGSPSSASTSSTCRRSTRSGTRTARAANNALAPGPGDLGSPWAIGAEEGGHDAIHPELGTWDDFDALVAAARGAGLEIALDFAIQCSPDHPWLKEHPEWFNRRPDGTLKYAENPPKRYQDIYNVNFESEDWRGLWQALLDVVLVWVERGVTRLPRRQPAHEAGRVLGVADPRGAHGAPRGDLPRRGVHAAGR